MIHHYSLLQLDGVIPREIIMSDKAMSVLYYKSIFKLMTENVHRSTAMYAKTLYILYIHVLYCLSQ